MCCLFGLIDSRRVLTGRQKSRLIACLSQESEARGTDAAGIAYNSHGRLCIYKRPGPAHQLRFRIPEDAREHIFERFYRVDKARSRQAGGSGLGLSIVHDLVERNFGEIQVGARDGGGTVFIVTFPYFDMEVEE